MHDIAIDIEDGLPMWVVPSGGRFVDGQLAWERLAVGMRCETWLAWSLALWSPVVVKLARPHQLTHPRALLSLGREVTAIRGSDHPGLPRLLADRRDDTIAHLVMEHVDGPSLDDVIDGEPLLSGEVALLAAALLSALATVHDRGVAHVDLKPENILVRNGRPVLVDFGSARSIGAEQPAGRAIGTAGYAAPELEDGASIAVAMDMYGVGTVLFETLTGRPAFDPGIHAADRPPAGPLPDTTDPGLAALVGALLEPDPANRPAPIEAMQSLADCGAAHQARPWPQWADTHLPERFPTTDGDRRCGAG